MALVAALRRASSAAVVLLRGNGILPSVLRHQGPAFRQLCRVPAAFRPFSSSPSSAASRLVKVIEDEIRSSVDSSAHDEVLVPSDFSFRIVDKSGDETITLQREYDGETISVVVYPEADVNIGESEDDGQSDNEGGSMNLSISLTVTVDKGDNSVLEFNCSISSESLQIHHMTTKNEAVSEDQRPYEGPPFSDLDENLQNEFLKYLEVRGIKSSLFDFLRDYMIKKDDREYQTWLNNMKEFIEA